MIKRWIGFAAALALASALTGCGGGVSATTSAAAASAPAATEAGAEAKAAAEAGTEVKSAAEAAAASQEPGAGGNAESARTMPDAKAESGAAETSSAGPERIQMNVWEHPERVKSEKTEGAAADFCSTSLEFDAQTEARFPELYQALDQISQDDFSISDEVMNNVLGNAEELTEGSGTPHVTAEYITVRPGRTDAEIVSMLRTRTTDLGGAHDYWEHRGWTFRSETGEVLKLTDLVTDRQALPALIAKEMEKEYREQVSLIGGDKDDPAAYIDGVLKKYEEAGVDIWYLTPDGLAFNFGPYVLDLGFSEQVVLLKYADYPDLFQVSVPSYPLLFVVNTTGPEQQVSERGWYTGIRAGLYPDYEKYPELAEALVGYNEDVKNRMEGYLKELQKDGEKVIGDAYFFEAQYITVDQIRMENGVLTFRETTALSGVEPERATETYQEYSFDMKTGEQLAGPKLTGASAAAETAAGTAAEPAA